MPEEQQPESSSPVPAKNLGLRRRGRRGGRGRRRPAPAIPATEQLPQTEPPLQQIEPPIRLREMPVRPVPSKQKLQAPVPASRAVKPDGSAISQAISEITKVVESLRQSLEQMEEILELVELAERQKLTDEREIESLLRALRQLQSHGGRPERQERPQSDD
ncbi:MAG: hypothetical protein ABSG87_00285 [Verrucomicrobiota bacterium]|jgi:hypothetical protein